MTADEPVEARKVRWMVYVTQSVDHRIEVEAASRQDAETLAIRALHNDFTDVIVDETSNDRCIVTESWRVFP